jgi:uncharacterized lipoprotein YddW (UPF0748 family)
MTKCGELSAEHRLVNNSNVMKLLTIAILFVFALRADGEYRGMWVNPIYNQAAADTVIADAVKMRANAIFVQIRPDNFAAYRSCVSGAPISPHLASGFDSVAYVIQKAHENGIEYHAWVSSTFLTYSARDSRPAGHIWADHGHSQTGYANWVTYTPNAAGLQTGKIHIDPGHPGAMEWAVESAVAFLDCYEPDGVHLDYIRYPYQLSNAQRYGYNQASVDRYNRVYGTTGTPAVDDPKWEAWRREQVRNIVRQVYLRAKEKQPKIKISAAVVVWGDYPGSQPSGENFAATEVYRVAYVDWHGWLESGWLDVAIPMLYRNEANPGKVAVFNAWVDWMKEHRHGRAIAVGLDWGNAPSNILEQANRVVRTYGMDGFVGFRYGLPAQRELAELYNTTYAALSEAPKHAWIENPTMGMLSGRVSVKEGPAHGNDRLTAELHPASRRSSRVGRSPAKPVQQTYTDAVGFYGFNLVAPGSYYVVLKNGGKVLHTSEPVEIRPGRISRVDASVSQKEQ